MSDEETELNQIADQFGLDDKSTMYYARMMRDLIQARGVISKVNEQLRKLIDDFQSEKLTASEFILRVAMIQVALAAKESEGTVMK